MDTPVTAGVEGCIGTISQTGFEISQVFPRLSLSEDKVLVDKINNKGST